MDERLYTIKEVVAITGLDARQIMYRLRRKHVPAKKLGWQWVIDQEGLERFQAIANSERKRLPDGVVEKP